MYACTHERVYACTHELVCAELYPLAAGVSERMYEFILKKRVMFRDWTSAREHPQPTARPQHVQKHTPGRHHSSIQWVVFKRY